MASPLPEKLPLSGAVLAGGRARRFGGLDKTRIRLGTENLLDRTLKLLDGFCRELLLSSNTLKNHPRARVVPDRQTGQGPLGAIYSCLTAAAHPWLLVVAGDMPFITAPALLQLWELRTNCDVVIPRSPDGLQPLAALYHHRCLPFMAQQLEAGNLKIKDFFPSIRVRIVDCPDYPEIYSEHTFLNINSPADLKKALILAKTN